MINLGNRGPLIPPWKQGKQHPIKPQHQKQPKEVKPRKAEGEEGMLGVYLFITKNSLLQEQILSFILLVYILQALEPDVEC